MNLSAIQHFAYDSYCYQLNNDDLEISIITGKDVNSVFLLSGDPFARGIMGGNNTWVGTETEITCKKELQNHYRWTVKVSPQFKRLSYCFRIVCGSEQVYLTHDGFETKEQYEDKKRYHAQFIYPWMNPADTCVTPEWAQNTVWYQIFPARFCRGKTNYVPEKMLPWPTSCEEPLPVIKPYGEPVYGGNIQGIIERLDYLKDLGITGIYTTPLNKSTSQHKYNTDDYTTIDPEFGDETVMKEFVAQAHARGIRVMLDGVFNHSGWFFDKWQDVWEKREKSEYADWFMVNDFNFEEPDYGYGKGNSGKGKYFAFAFVDWMPKLNTNNPKVITYLIDICTMWVKKYDIDGLRLDVANEISHLFCVELRRAMKALKSDFYIMGEIWHNSQPWLRGTEFDSVMNYPLQNGIANFLCNKNFSVKELEYAVNRCYSMYYRQINRVLFNQVDSHDTIRFLNRCDGDKVKTRQALALLFAMTGSVCIYYGTEILMPGGHDPDNRRCMPWKDIDSGKFASEQEFMKSLISLRKNHPAMISPDYDFIYDDSDPEGKSRVLHLLKVSEKDDERIHLYLNCSGSSFDERAALKGKELLLKSEGIYICREL